MLWNHIFYHLKKTFQSIDLNQKIEFSLGRSVKFLKNSTWLQNISNTTVKVFDTSKNGQIHEEVYSTIKHLSVQ